MAPSKIAPLTCTLALAAPAHAASAVGKVAASALFDGKLSPEGAYKHAKLALLATSLEDGSAAAISTWEASLSVLGGAASSAVLLFVIWLIVKYTSSSNEKDDGDNETEGVWRGGVCEKPEKPIDTGVTSAAASGTMCALLMAIPSIVGSWCWPLLLVTAFGAGSSVASDTYREISHHFTLGADIVLFGAMVGYVARNSKPGEWGPFAMLSVGSVLMIVDPLRHVLLDHGGVFFKPESIAMFADDGGLSFAGRTSQLCTVFGLLLLVMGVSWFMNLPQEFQRIMSSAKK